MTVAERCQCATPEDDGTVKHGGRLVTFESRNVNFRNIKHTVIVCWHHRKWYSGWKKAEKK